MEITLVCESCSNQIRGSSDDRILECDCGQRYMVTTTAIDAPS